MAKNWWKNSGKLLENCRENMIVEGEVEEIEKKKRKQYKI